MDRLCSANSDRLGQAFDSASAIASAYQVGRTEAAAATNLLNNVSSSTREQLKNLARPGLPKLPIHDINKTSWLEYARDWSLFWDRIFTQPKFIHHDGIAAGIFNMDYNGAGSSFGAWGRTLINTQELLNLMMTRMRKDFESLAPKMRKPWGQQQLDSLVESEMFPCTF